MAGFKDFSLSQRGRKLMLCCVADEHSANFTNSKDKHILRHSTSADRPNVNPELTAYSDRRAEIDRAQPKADRASFL
jgi:hypothetical protein